MDGGGGVRGGRSLACMNACTEGAKLGYGANGL